MKLSADASLNREHWNRVSDEYQARHGEQLATNQLAWGAWSIPEDDLRVLGSVDGKDVLEFGCGAAQWSIGLTGRGARCVALDLSERQLDHARANMRRAAVDFPLLHASAENVPMPNESFDIVFCDHGAMTFADPAKTVPEAARLLRPGGIFAFSASTPLLFVCWDDARDAVSMTLQHRYFQERRSQNDSSVCYSLPYGDWIALFRQNGFTIDALIELQAPPEARTTYDDFIDRDWAASWPAEQIWRVVRDRSSDERLDARR